MKKETFQLRPTDKHIELIKLLKLLNFAQSGGHAKMIVNDGLVKVNGVQEFRKTNKLKVGDIIELEDNVIEIVQ